MDRTQQIAELNDKCRQYLGASGRLVVSGGIASLDPDKQRRILMRVQNHRRFDEGNDPYGEHDFGAFESDDGRIFWKIDYYDPTLTYGSEDPADPDKTLRVLTVMFGSEY